MKRLINLALGPVTERVFLSTLVNHMPRYIREDIYTLGINVDKTKIFNFLTRKHFDFKVQKGKANNKNNDRASDKSSFTSKLLKSNNMNIKSNSTSEQKSTNQSAPKGDKYCNYCEKSINHTITDCTRLAASL